MSLDVLHIPVMLSEVMEWLGPQPGESFIDATLGLGGHALRVLEMTSPDGRLLGMDRDGKALGKAKARLAEYEKRILFVCSTFDRVVEVAGENGFKDVSGILVDLGVSSLQLDDPDRGFSIMKDGPLDMRMDPANGESAASLIERIEESRLADILFNYGEERFSRRIARRICEERNKTTISTTSQLAKIVEAAVPGRRGRIHPATRTFQALRIAVNDELGMLERFLDGAPSLLKPGGRIVVISYHSLEDRLVKNSFRDRARIEGKVLTKKVIRPSGDEVEKNPRSRSAKLRVFEKIGNGEGVNPRGLPAGRRG